MAVAARRFAVIATAMVLAGLASGCAAAPSTTPREPTPQSPTAPAPTESTAAGESVLPEPYADGTIAEGLAAPWSVAFLPDGSALVSERDTAKIKRLTPEPGGQWTATDIAEISGVDNQGEGGLLGLAVVADPTAGGAMPTKVLAYWSTREDNRVGSMTWDGERLSEPEVILDGIPHAMIHNGGRMAVAADGTVFIATGDAADENSAQDRSSLAGKVLRINADGTIPIDNPFPESAVYSLGHRNIQGLAFDPSGQLWASEFGAGDADELNLIEPGANYGWPEFEGVGGERAGFTDPVVQWRPTSIASPSGLAIADGQAWVAGLRGQTLWQVPLAGQSAGEPVARLQDQYGRLRDVVTAPSGDLWVITNNTDGRGEPRPGDDRILRLQLRR